MRSVSTFTLLLALAAVSAGAQQSEPAQAPLTVHSTLVMVPVLVTTKAGKVVFELTADDFLVTDNGVRQKVALDPETDSQPLALAIVVETGGAGVNHLKDYQGLDSILDSLIGDVEHRVALVGFDSTPRLLVPFTSTTSRRSQRLSSLGDGDHASPDPGAAILDAVAFAVAQLRTQPGTTGGRFCC